MSLDPEADLRRILFETPSGPRQLTALLPILPQSLMAFAGFVATSMLIEDPQGISSAIDNVARRLSTEERDRFLAEAVQEGFHRPSRAALVPDHLVRTAVNATQQIGPYGSLFGRTILLSRLSEPERTAGLADLLETIGRRGDVATNELVLSVMLPHLLAARQPVLQLIDERLREGQAPSGELLLAVALSVPPAEAERLLNAWSSIVPTNLRLELAGRMLPGLPESVQWRLALELVSAAPARPAHDRARFLLAASAYVDPDTRNSMQPVVLEAAQAIEADSDRAEILAEFASIAEGPVLMQLSNVASGLQQRRARDSVLRRLRGRGVLTPGFEPDQVPDLDQIFALVARLPEATWHEMANSYLAHLLEQWADIPQAAAPPPPPSVAVAPSALESPTRGAEEVLTEVMPWDIRRQDGPSAPPAPPAPSPSVSVRDRLVSTGFAAHDAPDTPLESKQALAPAQAYYFWFSLAPSLQPGAIERLATPLPVEQLPVGTRLSVVLYGFEDGLEFPGDEDIGELVLDATGSFRVATQPARDLSTVKPELLERRLFFSVRTPATPGLARLRCNVYCQGVLLESRLVQAVVGPADDVTATPALQATVDYTLSRSLDALMLRDLSPHRLCVLMNDNGDGTHGLRLYSTHGVELMKRDTRLSEFELQGLIDVTRRSLRRVAWGDETDWTDDKRYRYADDRRDMPRLIADLARLAVAGYRVYTRLVYSLAGSERATLERLLRESASVQIAARESATAYVPAALIYDCHWDTNAFPISTTQYRMCSTFETWLLSAAPVDECPCLHGSCPTRIESEAIRADRSRLMAELGPVICPSGFWGFRHAMGFPLSVGDTDDAPLTISVRGAPSLTAGIWKDFDAWPNHEQWLRANGRQLDVAASRQDLLRLLRADRPHVVYFFCHGGVAADGSPCLFVGGPDDSGITPDNLESNGIIWESPQPLVFINGCKTTALEPRLAFEFVSSFVRELRAAGVIGTEITVFEHLASNFGEALLDAFFRGIPIGEAVRQARLDLLAKGNPLGLVYIPFVIASLKMLVEP